MKSASSDILVYYSAIAVLGTGMVTEYVSVTVRRPSIGHRRIEYFLGQLLADDWAAVERRLAAVGRQLSFRTGKIMREQNILLQLL